MVGPLLKSRPTQVLDLVVSTRGSKRRAFRNDMKLVKREYQKSKAQLQQLVGSMRENKASKFSIQQQFRMQDGFRQLRTFTRR